MKILSRKIQERSIRTSETILSALKQMDEQNVKLLIVFDGDDYKGLLSIGDIQRAIIKNVSLSESIIHILRKDISVCQATDSFDQIKNKMVFYRSECMPIVDKRNNLVDVYFWEDIFRPGEKINNRSLNLPVVIMAGGQGTRMKPLTNIIPKPLIPIGEKTIIENIMDSFLEYGCSEFHLSVNYKSEVIRHYFEALANEAYRISYFEEDKPLGTAGSLQLLKDKIHSTFFVSNCDILINQDYGELLDFHRENKNEITVVAAMKHYPIPYGTIETKEDGLLSALIEKPEYTFKINAGFYILEPHLLDEIPKSRFYHITHLIEKLNSENRRVGVFPISQKSWQDIGEWSEYLDFLKYQKLIQLKND